MPSPIDVDVVIFGGGVAGLWTLARLRRAGYACLLLESASLGATQSIGSQGIIHGGVKYALLGEASSAARAVADMPARWAEAMAGRGDVDLSGVTTISPCTYVWTTPGLVSRLAGLAASKVLRTNVERVGPGERPPALAGAPKGVDVYRVDEPVLDARSVLGALLSAAGGAAVRYETGAGVACRAADDRAELTVSIGGERTNLHARHVLLTAGPGNENLLQSLRELSPPAATMQRRPLHMVMLRAPTLRLPALFGHCLGASSLPRLTVTSWHAGSREHDETVWYIGGQIAERGVALSTGEQIAAAREELAQCVRWIDTRADGCRWATVRWDRAEGLTANGSRPDLPVLHSSPLVSVGWPSKLALAPLLADQVLARLSELGVKPSGTRGIGFAPTAAATPAPLPWNDPSIQWT